jgi:hypothetical protein
MWCRKGKCGEERWTFRGEANPEDFLAESGRPRSGCGSRERLGGLRANAGSAEWGFRSEDFQRSEGSSAAVRRETAGERCIVDSVKPSERAHA